MKQLGHISRRSFVLIIALAFSVQNCDQSDRYGNLEAPSAQSVYLTSDYPAVAMVFTPDGGLCTGTFISPRTVLTAAHCTKSAGGYRVVTSFGSFTTATRLLNGSGDVDDPKDIALLIFSYDVASPQQGRVAAMGSPIALSERVRLVGFGCDDINTRRGSGRKRTGTNQVYRLGDYIELLTPLSTIGSSSNSARGILGASNRAGSCFGDSGGPMLRDDGEGEPLKLVGVCHAGGPFNTDQVSQYVDINQGQNFNFLQDADTQYSLHIFDTCTQSPSSCEPSSAFAQIGTFLRLAWGKFLSWLL